MKLIPYERKKLGATLGYKCSENLRILEEFADSGLDCAKVEGWTAKTAGYSAAALKKSIARYKFAGITAISRKGEVYLIKEI